MNGLTNYLGHLQVYVIVIGGETVSGERSCVRVVRRHMRVGVCSSAAAIVERGSFAQAVYYIRFKLRIFNKQKPGSRLTL